MSEGIKKLLEIMTKLRNPDGGCPWDVEQTFKSIAPYTIEEAYEVADAIDCSDMPALKDELGDLLFQVVFHSEIAKEQNLFDFSDVVTSVSDKMVRRHPHVFGDAKINNASEQATAWDDIKEDERLNKIHKDDPSVLAGVPVALPGLTRAEKLQKRAARIGFDWPTPEGVMDKVHEEIAEVEDELASERNLQRLSDEIGDLLFVCTNLARKLGIDAETALRNANVKFERRFRAMESRIVEKGDPANATLAQLEASWLDVKRQERA